MCIAEESVRNQLEQSRRKLESRWKSVHKDSELVAELEHRHQQLLRERRDAAMNITKGRGITLNSGQPPLVVVSYKELNSLVVPHILNPSTTVVEEKYSDDDFEEEDIHTKSNKEGGKKEVNRNDKMGDKMEEETEGREGNFTAQSELLPSSSAPELLPSSSAPELLPSSSAPELLPSSSAPELLPSSSAPELLPSSSAPELLPSSSAPEHSTRSSAPEDSNKDESCSSTKAKSIAPTVTVETTSATSESVTAGEIRTAPRSQLPARFADHAKRSRQLASRKETKLLLDIHSREYRRAMTRFGTVSSSNSVTPQLLADTLRNCDPFHFM